MNPFLAFGLWFVAVTLALVLWMLRIYGARAMQCPTGKVQHTLATAKAASKRARRRTEKTLAPYRCDLCGQWHVG